jgi:hypothetical protein
MAVNSRMFAFDSERPDAHGPLNRNQAQVRREPAVCGWPGGSANEPSPRADVPAALEAFDDLASADALELPGKAPDPPLRRS